MTMSQPADQLDVVKGRSLFPPASLGVIGSGQLGRMFIQAAQRMGYCVGVLSATEETPAAQVANWTVIGPPDHLPALRAFAQRTEAVTVEPLPASPNASVWTANLARSCASWLASRGIFASTTMARALLYAGLHDDTNLESVGVGRVCLVAWSARFGQRDGRDVSDDRPVAAHASAALLQRARHCA